MNSVEILFTCQLTVFWLSHLQSLIKCIDSVWSCCYFRKSKVRCNPFLKTALDFLSIFYPKKGKLCRLWWHFWPWINLILSWHLNKSRLENPEGSVCIRWFWLLANYLDLYLLKMRLMLAISKTLSRGSNIIGDLYHKHKWFILCHWNILQRNREQSAVIKMNSWNCSLETNKNCIYDSVVFIYKCCRV